MKKCAIVFLLLVSAPAMAQQTPPSQIALQVTATVSQMGIIMESQIKQIQELMKANADLQKQIDEFKKQGDKK